MPFYEYQCASCGHHAEIMQKVSDAPLRRCPSCGKNSLRKLISAPVFRLKGSGWYETDFKTDKERQRNLALERDKQPDAAAPKESTAESKPEEKPETKKPEQEKAPPPKSRRSAAAAKRKKRRE
jgi:putative FmdB family regulatory protein